MAGAEAGNLRRGVWGSNGKRQPQPHGHRYVTIVQKHVQRGDGSISSSSKAVSFTPHRTSFVLGILYCSIGK